MDREAQNRGTPDSFMEEAETMGLSSKLGVKSLDGGTLATMAASALSSRASLKWHPLVSFMD